MAYERILLLGRVWVNSKVSPLTKLGTGQGPYAPAQVAGGRYEAVLRLSEALSQCRDPEDLTTILSEELPEFLTFLQFYIVVYKENSDEVEWAVVGQEKSLITAYANVPVQERPSWQAYKTQEPFHIREWDTDARVPAQLRKGVADLGLDPGPLVFVPLTTPHRRLGALGMSGPLGTAYTSEDVRFLQLIGRVVALRISDSFNLQQAEAARLELERQNERLQRAERDLREVIETMPCLAWSATADGNAEFFNRRWLDYAGLTADQARGTGWTAAIHPNDLNGLVDYWRQILASGRPGELEARLRRVDGEYRWFLFRATPSFDENGKVVKWYGTNIDIEERKVAEDARDRLRRLEVDLAHMNRVSTMGELTASLAHEIKQPIGAAVTNAEACLRLLDRKQPDLPEAQEAALEMVKDARRAAAIIDRVRSLYQKGSPHWEVIDVNELIREMVVVLQNEANRRSITMRTNLAEGLPSAMGDRVQLQQALMNLMLNGIEAIRDTNGQLTVESRLAEDGQVSISVKDNGIGLPAGAIDRIFDAFFTTKPQGTGLGLAITRSVIEFHGGRIWATANFGQGTTFCFTLPIRTIVPA
jgi:PAS domain S-box-containing protein